MSTIRQQIGRLVPARLRPRLGELRRRFVARPSRVRRGMERLLAERERELLRNVDERVYPNDGMYTASMSTSVCGRRAASYYAMPGESVRALTGAYARTGRAYHDSPRGLGYFDFHPDKRGCGHLAHLARVCGRAQIERAGDRLRQTYFKARGWANHQDVHAFSKLP